MAEINELFRHEQNMVTKPHYAFLTRMLIDLFRQGELPNVRDITIEPEYGYVGRVLYQDQSVRMFRGSDVGINASAAKLIATDKGYTKYFLHELGYQTPPGKVFLLPHYVDILQKSLEKYGFQHYARIEEIDAYVVSTIGYPCFIKPNDGSQGKGISKCLHKDDVALTVQQYQQERINTLLVEKTIPWPDYRVVVFKDEAVICYLRTPLTVIGDGSSTIKELLWQKHAQLVRTGRPAIIDMDDARIARQLARRNYRLETVLPRQFICPIYDVSNLSAGGDMEDFTERIAPYWRDVCISLTAAMGLQLCGVDIACSDIEDAHADYSILEINDSPGLANYAMAGEKQFARVRELYKRIFDLSPGK